MDQDSRQVSRLWRVYRTIHQMVDDRGYLVSYSELNMDLDAFRAQYARGGAVDRNSLTFLVQKRDDPADQVLVFFPEEPSLGVKTIRKYCERMLTQNVQKSIIIYPESLTPSAKKAVEHVGDKYHLELFKEADLLVNITHHNLVPRHDILSPEEKRTLLQRYRLKESQLPRILINDPVARYYGLKRGQVVKITRASETAGRYITYRLCM
ncbi:DNA-directed RNA polymerases II 24 kDa polypeptide (RNA polymerase II subunit 5) [Dimargaris verticillata]|uniref:DNA-directed RNA polymerases I, II, and III subunit RPABC1 n=1 Tax=Dimargaris verticillata TaxID=2761393 RepID=A0A9W8B3A0_9FUNG|nr:DNA-directed RNA polymerases II 24 kDa polypeptide (RNA polymerase II subunit 5) [Dimargaris xerosporica]KAJ1981210.1 DNA-directed RNA polymerases II 24 kDa polypeptide (RNA polymerase II subunit 5) [Dimargaris verticillata]